MSGAVDPVAAFIHAACVPLDAAHVSGTLDEANAILAANPPVATSSIHTAAILGDEGTVRRFLAEDPTSATAKSGPRGWDALTHLCFSRYLRLDAARSDGFVSPVRTATRISGKISPPSQNMSFSSASGRSRFRCTSLLSALSGDT